MGAARAINTASLRACVDGIARSVEVMVPGPWFPDAARILNLSDNSGRPIDCGIHLTLTSEWDAIKWRPLTKFPAVDGLGYFLRSVEGMAIFRGLFAEDIFRECSAQIEIGLQELPHVTHISSHMFAVPLNIMQRLADTFGLLCEQTGPKLGDRIPAINKIPDGGFYHFHPADESPEVAAIGKQFKERIKVTGLLCGRETYRAIKANGIELLSYGDFRKEFP